jgi:hypothetical protein
MTGHQREQQAALKNRFAVLGLVPDTSTPAAPPAAPRKQTAPRRPRVKKAASKAAPAPQRQNVPEPTATPMAVAQAASDEARPKRLMVPLSIDEDRALKEYRVADGFAAAARIRAMLQLYRTDERFRRRVDQTARDMR